MSELFTIEETHHYDNLSGAKIKVVGVGGGGGNMVNHMIRNGIDKNQSIDLITVNTDLQALGTSLAPTRIQLGPKLTKGLGAGMKPEIGRDSALESFDLLKDKLEGADIVFIAAGLGGGTGTGAAPIVAQAAKEMDALTVAVVTKPFKFEGRRRIKLAELGLEELKEESDSIVVIPNDKLLTIIEQKLGLKESFTLVDDILARAVSGMSSIILDHGNSDINVDFADVKTIMGHKGLALMGVGESQGTKAATEALQTAIESPLFDNMKIDGAMGVLIHFYIHPNYPLQDISDAMEHIEDNVDEDAQVIFGTTTDENLDQNTVKVTIVATGFEKDLNETPPATSRKEHYQQPQQHQTKTRIEREKAPISSQSNRQTHQVKREEPAQPKQEAPKVNRTKISIPNNEDDLELPSYLRLGQGRN